MSLQESKPRPLLTVKETAEYLDLPLRTVYRMVEADQIPHFKTGTRIRISRAKLEEWLGVPPGSSS